ncbi:formate dehydrogenase accessory protein FdhE [Anaeromyxobacter diazotrophicus]|uniref:Protein FdhE n=1 Tax=Anaeromyxobacter diazotrophicus TaxID=2590199 RepID=A0A7I9VM42_9BACT|nr:formate dehydrogenase accessory protein FdhE [Anaeromyxobacter diazotrophicus]GEJ57047.1 protein FdhE [Anaeromyxobacter diazotrophicus]
MTADPQSPSGPGGLTDIPHLRLPDAQALFRRRAERFAALAPGHTLSEYLELLGRVAEAQRVAAATLTPALPRALAPERPLDATNLRRGPEWLAALKVVLDALSAAEVPGESRAALALLAELPPPELEALADRVLANAVAGADLAAGAFVAAALQVHFTGLAAQLTPDAAPRTRDGCPACGSLPVVGIVLGDDKLRYLVCSLCGAQWHHTRVQCTACHEGKGLTYYQLGAEQAAAAKLPAAYVKAEACAACKAYTKLFYVEQAPALEPFADDVATLALDLLMAEEGWARHGVNLFLMAGEERLPDRR